jgi:hypothetical protein
MIARLRTYRDLGLKSPLPISRLLSSVRQAAGIVVIVSPESVHVPQVFSDRVAIRLDPVEEITSGIAETFVIAVVNRARRFHRRPLARPNTARRSDCSWHRHAHFEVE